jgi:hypothetical protein
MARSRVWAAALLAPLAAAAAEPVPADFAGLRALRPASSISLGGSQELKLTSTVDAPGWLLPYDLGDAWRAGRSELSQATYRYSLGRLYGSDVKLGLTASLPEYGSARRLAPGAARSAYSALPMLHLGSESLLGERWRLSLSADSTMTGRGYALDLGVQVNYLFGPNFSLYGGYRLTEAGGETEDFYLPGLTNAANIGLRYRF